VVQLVGAAMLIGDRVSGQRIVLSFVLWFIDRMEYTVRIMLRDDHFA
jgi:hypothetical protein